MDAGTLAHALDRLANTGRVLYVAAHPDDENTRLLAYLANNRHVTAAYLSMTRGGGGQNLIGPEQAELLGVIRTEELLAARRLDAAQQRFTSMRDFGYSKSAAETLDVWSHDEALAEVVWVIRKFQPDVIITRFNEAPPNHGHHTASAILAREAFTAAADPKRFPQQLKHGVGTWQANRLLLNFSTWRDPQPPKEALALDVGVFDARLGMGYGELAARSRSQHKSQGFGVAGERGPILEYFVPLAGTTPESDILEGLVLGWSRFGQLAAPLDAAFEQARAALDRDAPEKAIPSLLVAHAQLAGLPRAPRVVEARRLLDELIAACAGLFVRATTAVPAAAPGSKIGVKVEVAVRRPTQVRLRQVTIDGASPTEVDALLEVGGRREIGQEVAIPSDAPISTPYWLSTPPMRGRYVVGDPKLGGLALGPPALSASVGFTFGDRQVELQVPVVYAWTDRVHGERVRPFLIAPPATVTPARRAVLLPNAQPASVTLRIRSGAEAVKGEVILPLPPGWHVEPQSLAFNLASVGDEKTVSFRVTAPVDAGPIDVRPEVVVDGEKWSYREQVIDYPHIPLQTVLQPATLRLVPLELRIAEGMVGYIPGSGDTVAEDLASVGIPVSVVDDETLRSGDLSRFKALVVGIRAYNTRPILRSSHARLMDYVKQGGTLVVQYNTSSEWAPLDTPIGPYPLTLGRGRVTDETAELVPVDPESALLTTPNRLTADDFAGWIQERGLYFAETFDDRYRPVFRAHDPGEEPLSGGLLVTDYGKGRYIYTGLAFFRQLPAGVPGAYRLFANLIGGEA